MGDYYCLSFFHEFFAVLTTSFFRDFPHTVIGVHAVSGSSVAVGIPANASNVVGVSTFAVIPTVADLRVSLLLQTFVMFLLSLLLSSRLF